MNSFLKGFCSIFDWMTPRSMEEQLKDLDDSMQDLYDRMGWGTYSYPNNNCTYISDNDIDRIEEAKTQYPIVKDPARPRTSKYYDRQQYK
jgi:hypothetical protein